MRLPDKSAPWRLGWRILWRLRRPAEGSVLGLARLFVEGVQRARPLRRTWVWVGSSLAPCLDHSMQRHLPPGQRERSDFPRFGLTQFARRFPREPSRFDLDVVGEVDEDLHLRDALAGLPRAELAADFHCVTTWTRRGLRWGGVRFVDFYEQVLLPQARPHDGATLVGLRGQDGARTGLPLKDLLAPEVLLADTLNGEPLSVAHGAPARLVAPAHYAYKSVKHLSRIEFMAGGADYAASGFRFMDHPRARVEFEERGRGLPGWLLRLLYRPLIRGTVGRFARGLEDCERLG
jgi:DMSO/TMAO reductase YedYZ molybdopterin-dependent catalytic subunit